MKSEPVDAITDEIRDLVRDMIETMDDADGLGLAAPQVNVSLRVFIVRPYVVTEDGEIMVKDVKVFINPKLSEPDEKMTRFDEGCLSIPKIYATVLRPQNVVIEAMDLDGNVFKENLSGIEARAVMHENDHLNGVLFIDRLNPGKRKEIEPLLKKIKSGFKKKTM